MCATIKNTPIILSLKNLACEVLQVSDEMCQAPADWDMLDDVGKAWSGKDHNHFEVAYIKKESPEVSPDMPGTHHRECMDGRGKEIQSIQTLEDSNHIWGEQKIGVSSDHEGRFSSSNHNS